MVSNNCCQLFIVFPEYEDSAKTTENIQDIGLLYPDEYIGFIRLLTQLNKQGKAEHYKLFYDKNNLSNFIIPLEELPECYPSIEQTLLLTLNGIASNWRNERIQRDEIMYAIFNKSIADDTFCESCERKYKAQCLSEDSTFAIINHKAISRIPSPVTITRNGEHIIMDVVEGNIDYIKNWLKSNRRPQRIYNWNPKHGEFGKGAHPDNDGYPVAVLYCSREHAADLLNEAIGENETVDHFMRGTKNTIVIWCSKENLLIVINSIHII